MSERSKERLKDSPKQSAEGYIRLIRDFSNGLRELEGEDGKKFSPSESLTARIADTEGLLQGIASGVITTGQPRIAANLIWIVEELESKGFDDYASECVEFLSYLAEEGLTAENCRLTPKHQARIRD